MNLRCRIGWHDWEIHQKMDLVTFELAEYGKRIYTEGSFPLKYKTCKRCGKEIDQFKDHMKMVDEIIEIEKLSKELEERNKKMLSIKRKTAHLKKLMEEAGEI